MSPELRRAIIDRACAFYFDTGKFNYYWGRGKLGCDPIFAALIDQQVFPDHAKVLDLGCGRGLLAAWLLAAEQIAHEGGWPGDTPRPARNLQFRGVELMGKEPACGNHALSAFGSRVCLEQGDMRQAEANGINAIAILDVLHYINYAEQDALLDRLCAALPPGGIFLTRVGNANGGLRFRLSQLADRSISFIQGHRLPRMWCRSIDDWLQCLRQRGMTAHTQPMSRGTPFANIMIVAHKMQRA